MWRKVSRSWQKVCVVRWRIGGKSVSLWYSCK
nr:MAG TPA: hypothetical protein [Caudoviricetes sp.]